MYAKLLHIDAIDEHLALLYIIVARNEVDEGGFSTTALTHNRYRLTLWYREVDISQYPLLTIAEGYVAELYLMLEAWNMLRILYFLNRILGQQDLVDTLHRCKALGNIVAHLGNLLQRVDDRVQNHHIINKGRTRK